MSANALFEIQVRRTRSALQDRRILMAQARIHKKVGLSDYAERVAAAKRASRYVRYLKAEYPELVAAARQPGFPGLHT